MSINGERNGSTLKFSYLGRPMNRRRLLGYSPWGCTELDITQQLSNNNDHKGCILHPTVYLYHYFSLQNNL